MAALATVDDVAARWRPLSASESTRASVLLDEGSALLRQLVDELDDRIVADPDLGTIATGVLASMVLRVMRNPDGKLSESIDDYSYRRSAATSDGSLYVSEAELARLTLRSVPLSGAYVVSLNGYPLL